MAATALEVVSAEEIKRELRLEVSDSDQDELLESQIAAAVSLVARQISTPLVDVTETIHVPRPPADQPLCFRALAVKAVLQIHYWTPAGALRDPADGMIDKAELGRRVSRDRSNTLYPPPAGWPEILDGSLLALKVKRGLELSAQTKALKQAVILCVRQFYDGYREIRPTEAFYALIAPFRRYD